MRERCVEPEWLDELPPEDPRAIGSRDDLVRLNRIMRHAHIIASELRGCGFPEWGRRIIDLGSGDGSFLLKVATRLPEIKSMKAVPIDRMQLMGPPVRERFTSLGWDVNERTGDVFKVLADLPRAQGTAVIANLFLHHLRDELLRDLFAVVAERAEALVACEPRRARRALVASRLVGLVGCNAVTRHDAVASVRAGFADSELTRLWNKGEGWATEEKAAGWFAHLFVCRTGR